jgi:hypothetical protein
MDYNGSQDDNKSQDFATAGEPDNEPYIVYVDESGDRVRVTVAQYMSEGR